MRPTPGLVTRIVHEPGVSVIRDRSSLQGRRSIFTMRRLWPAGRFRGSPNLHIEDLSGGLPAAPGHRPDAALLPYQKPGDDVQAEAAFARGRQFGYEC